MVATRFGLLGALACLPAFAQVSNVFLSQDPVSLNFKETMARRQHGPIRDNTEHGDGTTTSSNWSGWAVLGSSFTSVSGVWVVPSVICAGGDQYASFWVGIDGYSSGTVEQIGTDSDCDGTNKPSYYAWYEFYPAGSFNIGSVPVSPGNVISASVVYSSSEFTATITNETTGKSYSKSSTVRGAQRSSAEWIAEAPCCAGRNGILPLSDFGTVDFGPYFTSGVGNNEATNSSVTKGVISAFGSNTELIDKAGTSTSPQTSTCSNLYADGQSFTCTYGAGSPGGGRF